MATWVWILIVIAAVVVVALMAMAARQRRTAALRQRFGPEYDRAVEARGYPMADFDAQADLVSVDHPDVVENYRFAHDPDRHVDGQAAAGSPDIINRRDRGAR